MTQIMEEQEAMNQGWIAWLLTVVCEKCFAWICHFPTGSITPEAMMFMNYTGFGVEEAMAYQHFNRIKLDATSEK